MSPKSTISAQKLYEGGYITYMRTDSFDLSDKNLLDMITNYINQNYGEQYLKIQAYKSKSKNMSRSS